MEEHIAVYTCITGGFDKIQRIINSQPKPALNLTFSIYTDQVSEPSKVKGKTVDWQLLPLIYESYGHPDNDRRTARWHKIKSHRTHSMFSYSIWIDGSQEIKAGVDCREMVDNYLTCKTTEESPRIDIAAFKHPQRNCIYQELEACAKLKKDDPVIMRAQIERYMREGYPALNGLVETACVIRRHSNETIGFNDYWWNEIENGSKRDQLSFNYVMWKLGLQYNHVTGRRDNSPYFHFHPHK